MPFKKNHKQQKANFDSITISLASPWRQQQANLKAWLAVHFGLIVQHK
jgi:hypothetical protein